jgi:hypothetical protein
LTGRGGVALILWASHLLVRDFPWAFTHGTTEAYEGLTFLGLSPGQYAVVWAGVRAGGPHDAHVLAMSPGEAGCATIGM